MASVVPAGYVYWDGFGYVKEDDRTGPYAIDSGGVARLMSGGVPDGGTAGQVLTKLSGVDGDAEWASPSGAGLGDVAGPASSVTGQLATFNGTSGKIIQASGLTGIVKAASGVPSAAVAGTDYYAPAGTDVSVTDGGTGRSTGTTAYALVATGTTATGAQQSLAAGATTELLVGGGASALPVWTTATGSGAPVRATSPTLVTPTLGVASATTLTLTNDLGVTHGGTGASDAAGARTNLGLVIGTDVQAFQAAQAQATWEAGVGTTESVTSPAKIDAEIVARSPLVPPRVVASAATTLTLDASNKATYANALIEFSAATAVTVTVDAGFWPASVAFKQTGAGTVTATTSGGAVIGGDTAATIALGAFVSLIPSATASNWTAITDRVEAQFVSLGANGNESSVTGTTTETVLWEVVVPGGSLGMNDSLIVKPLWYYTNSANNKTLRVRFGPSTDALAARNAIFGHTKTSTATSAPHIEMVMRNSTTAAVMRHVSGGGTAAADGYSDSASLPTTFVVDTEVDNLLSVTGTLVDSAELITLAHVRANIERGV